MMSVGTVKWFSGSIGWFQAFIVLLINPSKLALGLLFKYMPNTDWEIRFTDMFVCLWNATRFNC